MMVLTVLELWVACDEAALKMCPLIRDYPPSSLQHELLQNLLLPSKTQMERLRVLELYIADRRSRATYASAMLFDGLESSDSFPVKFFDQHQQHQALLQQITTWAHNKRQQKISEFQRLKQQHADLMQNYNNFNNGNCEMVEVRLLRDLKQGDAVTRTTLRSFRFRNN